MPRFQRKTLDSVRYVFSHFLQYATQDKFFLLLNVALILGIVLSNTVLIWLLGMPVNLMQSGEYEQLNMALLALAVVLVVNQLFHFFNVLTTNWIGLRFIGRVRLQLLTHLMMLSSPVVSDFQKGDLLARISNDVDQVQQFLIEVPLGLVSHFFTLVFYVCMLVWIDLELALIALLFIPGFYLHQRYFAPRKGRAGQEFFDNNGKLLAFEEQSLGNLRGISSFNAEKITNDRHANIFETVRHWAMKTRTIDAVYALIFSLLTYGCGIVIVFIGINGIQQGEFSIGHLISFLLYLGYITVPVRGFANVPVIWQGQLGAVERVIQLLLARPKIVHNPDAKPLVITNAVIRIEDLSFAYDNERPIFDSVSVVLNAGETVALVGPSGSGKSTLARLLVRFYDPQAGSIYIDDQDIRDVTMESLRDNIAVVWQEPFIINDTIAANLRLARPQASDAQLKVACKAAFAWEFITDSELGLKTKLGDVGVDLSAGQRQRLSIAQAFLRDAPILVMDEASSALDSQSEQAVINALTDLRKGRTTLIIAHRYSSIRMADKILYLNGDGSIAIGEHEELLNHHAGYKEALDWQTQVNG